MSSTETRRSSRRLETAAISGTGQGSAGKEEEEEAQDVSNNEPETSSFGGGNLRKRTRQSETREFGLSSDTVPLNRKRAKPNTESASSGTACTANISTAPSSVMSRDQEHDRDLADDVSTAPSVKKLSPLETRMQIVSDQYQRLAQALLTSEISFLEHSIQEVKKGQCRELVIAIEPHEERRIERKRIANIKLQLQRDQITREWHANRYAAHLDYFKQRADLRHSCRRNISGCIFDIGREYSNLCVESSIVGSWSNLFRAPSSLLTCPRGATFTEKDEDFLLMDIRPPTKDNKDAGVMSAVPVLDGLASMAALARSSPRAVTAVKRPKVFKSQASAAGQVLQNGPLPGITAIIKKEKKKTSSTIPVPPAKAHHAYFIPQSQTHPTNTILDEPQRPSPHSYMLPPSATFHIDASTPDSSPQGRLLNQRHFESVSSLSFPGSRNSGRMNSQGQDPPLRTYPSASITHSAFDLNPSTFTMPRNPVHSSTNQVDAAMDNQAYQLPTTSPANFARKAMHNGYDYKPRPQGLFLPYGPQTISQPQQRPFPGQTPSEPLLHPFRRSDADRIEQHSKNGILWAGLRRTH